MNLVLSKNWLDSKSSQVLPVALGSGNIGRLTGPENKSNQLQPQPQSLAIVAVHISR